MLKLGREIITWYCVALNTRGCPVRQLDNVLLSGQDPQLVKLCDFGYSKDGDLESACKTTCGTPEYMAPEVRGQAMTQTLYRAAG